MKTYTREDIVRALRDSGVRAGDIVLFTVRLFTVGRLIAARSADHLNAIYLEALQEVIGTSGTLVVLTYSQQVGLFGLPYIHETTPTLTGSFSEAVRVTPGAIRSFHPVFSLTALGPQADKLCGDVGTSGFGARSAYDHLFQRDTVCVSLGFDYDSGYIVTGAHYVEAMYGVPYFYNKILDADVYKDGVRSSKVFVLNVRYNGFDIQHDFRRYIAALADRGMVSEAPVGDSMLYASRLQDQLKVGYELLGDDVYAFLKQPPTWKPGIVPKDGPPLMHEREAAARITNWNGYVLDNWGANWKPKP